jgi:ketosteroid isomerase-like protein
MTEVYMLKSIVLLVALITLNIITFAQSATAKTEREIIDLMQKFAEAALKSDVSVAEKIFANNLILTSQSGKVYGKKDALLDLKNPFEKYQNDEIKFIHLNKKTVIVSYQNMRKRKGLDEAKFRVTAVWSKNKSGWQIVSLQSSKITTGM